MHNIVGILKNLSLEIQITELVEYFRWNCCFFKVIENVCWNWSIQISLVEEMTKYSPTLLFSTHFQYFNTFHFKTQFLALSYLLIHAFIGPARVSNWWWGNCTMKVIPPPCEVSPPSPCPPPLKPCSLRRLFSCLLFSEWWNIMIISHALSNDRIHSNILFYCSDRITLHPPLTPGSKMEEDLYGEILWVEPRTVQG